MVAAFSLGYRPGTHMFLDHGPHYFKFDNIHDADNENFAESDKMDAAQRKAKEPRHWPGGWGGYSEDDMIVAGVADVKNDPGTGGGASSASDAKKDTALAKSPMKGKGKSPVKGNASMEGKPPTADPLNAEEAEEAEGEEETKPPPQKKTKKENSSKMKIDSLDVRCRDSNMAMGCMAIAHPFNQTPGGRIPVRQVTVAQVQRNLARISPVVFHGCVRDMYLKDEGATRALYKAFGDVVPDEHCYQYLDMFYDWAKVYMVIGNKTFIQRIGDIFRGSLDNDFGKGQHKITWSVQMRDEENLLRRPMKVLRIRFLTDLELEMVSKKERLPCLVEPSTPTHLLVF